MALESQGPPRYPPGTQPAPSGCVLFSSIELFVYRVLPHSLPFFWDIKKSYQADKYIPGEAVRDSKWWTVFRRRGSRESIRYVRKIQQV